MKILKSSGKKLKKKKKSLKKKLFTIEILRTHVAGIQYNDYQLVVGLNAGRKVELLWERNNKFDSKAIKVSIDGIKIGYIPKEYTELLHEYRNAGIPLTAEVTSFIKSNPSWRIIIIKVTAKRELEENLDFDMDNKYNRESFDEDHF